MMDAITMIKERRSVRKFKNEKVDRELMNEIMDLTRWAPSWGNAQVARYTLIDDDSVIKKLSTDGVKGFIYNKAVLENAKGVAVISFVEGKSGKLDKSMNDAFENKDAELEKEGYRTYRSNEWEIFDAGIACQTFCLAAHAKGVGTCVMGVIDEKSIAQIIELPSEETVAALVVYGYEEGEHVAPTPRKDIEEIARFI